MSASPKTVKTQKTANSQPLFRSPVLEVCSGDILKSSMSKRSGNSSRFFSPRLHGTAHQKPGYSTRRPLPRPLYQLRTALSRSHTPPVERPRVAPIDALPIPVRGRVNLVHLVFAMGVYEDIEGAEAEGPLSCALAFSSDTEFHKSRRGKEGGRKGGMTHTPVVDPNVMADGLEGDAPVADDLGTVAAPAAFAFFVSGGVGREPAVVGARFEEGGGVVEEDVGGGGVFGGGEGEGGGAGGEEGGEEGGEFHDGCFRGV